MTTRAAAGPSTPGRLFLGRVVPLLYVLALVVTAVLARAGDGGPTAARTEAMQAASQVRPLTTKRPRHVARPRHHHGIRHRGFRPPTRIVTAPESVEAAVSRSDDREITAPPAKVSLIIRIASVASPSTMQAAINECRGPVEVVWGWYPTEIAEHDFCGGAVFSSLSAGERVRVVGGGLSGVYVANGQRRFAAAGSSAQVLSGMGDLVLQTCVSDGVILVGLDRMG